MGPVTVVFDTNVLVSALGFGGDPLRCLLLAIDRDVRIAASEETLAELYRVMEYERLPFTQEDRAQYREFLEREFAIVTPTEAIHEVDADPDDDAFLECAVAAEADYVVSGDRHLLDLGEFRGIEIVTPATFLERLK